MLPVRSGFCWSCMSQHTGIASCQVRLGSIFLKRTLWAKERRRLKNHDGRGRSMQGARVSRLQSMIAPSRHAVEEASRKQVKVSRSGCLGRKSLKHAHLKEPV